MGHKHAGDSIKRWTNTLFLVFFTIIKYCQPLPNTLLSSYCCKLNIFRFWLFRQKKPFEDVFWGSRNVRVFTVTQKVSRPSVKVLSIVIWDWNQLYFVLFFVSAASSVPWTPFVISATKRVSTNPSKCLIWPPLPCGTSWEDGACLCTSWKSFDVELTLLFYQHTNTFVFYFFWFYWEFFKLVLWWAALSLWRVCGWNFLLLLICF